MAAVMLRLAWRPGPAEGYTIDTSKLTIAVVCGETYKRLNQNKTFKGSIRNARIGAWIKAISSGLWVGQLATWG